MQGSANLNIMIKAARKAGRSLIRDFGEVEKLQVSAKGAGDFVSKADIRAEELSGTNVTTVKAALQALGRDCGPTRPPSRLIA